MTSLPSARPATGRALSRLAAPPVAAPRFASPNWLLGFFYVETACQVALLFPALAGARAAIRSTSFAASLVLALMLRRQRANHPSRNVAFAALVVVGLSIFHPNTNNTLAGLATLGLNLAILGPIFWVPRLRIDLATVRRLFFVFWAFNTASAALGVLQIYFPGQFQPALSIGFSDENYVHALEITLANGERVLRPMGLTDSPGGAGIGGVYAILFSAAFLLDRPRVWFRMALYASIMMGCFSLYLCQVRSLVVMLVISFVAITGLFMAQGRVRRLTAVAFPLVGAAVVSFIVAVAVGGQAVTGRLSTLLDGDPGDVYYSNRGRFLEYTFVDLLPQYPFGAGLGRWGMMSGYFGDYHNMASQPIWAEVQWTGWLLDGGVALMVAYAVALVLAVREAMRIALRRGFAGDEELNKWGAVLTGFGISLIASTFAACPFEGTLGINFWLLNATVFAASCQLSASDVAS